MTIGKKLYLSFGSIVVILVLLFITNTMVDVRQRAASDQASLSLERVATLEAVQFMMMQSRLSLRDYLLTGNTRERDNWSRDSKAVADLFAAGRARNPRDLMHGLLARMEANSRDWNEKFAAPVAAQRARVDAGDATVDELLLFYAQQDPTGWAASSMAAFNQASVAIHQQHDASEAATNRVLSIGTMISTVVTVLAILLCAGIAYFTARSITGPIEETVGVLRNMAEEGGDLTRRVNQSTGDELGEMGRCLNIFIVKLEGLVGMVARSTQVVAGSSENLFTVSHQMGARRRRDVDAGQRRRGGGGTGDAKPADRRRGHRGDDRQHRRDREERERRRRNRRRAPVATRLTSPTSRWSILASPASRSARSSR